MKKLSVLLILVLIGAVLFASGQQDSANEGGEKVFNIDLATAYASSGPAGQALAQFVKDVNEKSNGTIKINLFTDGTLGNPKDNYGSISSGDLDMAMTGLEGLDLYAPEYTFLDCPFLIKDWNHLNALLGSGIGDKLKERYRENGIETLAWHNRDIRVLASNKKVMDPEDVIGLKLRLPGMQVFVNAWSYLNVSATTVAMSELYTALQTNVAEACEGGYEQMTTLKLYEVQDYIAETDHVFEFVGLFINKDLYNSMSERQKNVLVDCANTSMAYANKLAQDNREAFKNECLSNGMSYIQLNRENFRAKMKDYYLDMFEEKWTVASYNEVMSLAK